MFHLPQLCDGCGGLLHDWRFGGLLGRARLGCGYLVMNVDDEARRIRKQGSVELGNLIEIEHDPRPSGLELRHADVF